MGNHHNATSKITFAGLLITLGIIYGDIGTSPLYVMKAIVGETTKINRALILGGISCVFWTLTLQTTLKYVVLTLRADNKGEGGIFSLFTLVRKQGKWLAIPAMIGGAALLADGIITPPISVASAIEGLKNIKSISHEIEPWIVPIVIVIISVLFIFQRFGTAIVGRFFGPVMLVWFSMLAVLGSSQIINHFEVVWALNPYYAVNLLFNTPGGFWLLGAVFLCTTGAEALYSDLGHCGRQNIRISWVFVKTCLIINYFGQGAWLISHEGQLLAGRNPFYAVMPEWFLLTGIIIATFATIIASQALITGSFTLVSEAIRLDFWPKVILNYPSNVKGQLYVPSVNFLLWVGCISIVLIFQESSNMEAAYGLSITITMLMTSILLMFYLRMKGSPVWFVGLFILAYLAIEMSFLVANLTKFTHGGYVTIIVGTMIIFVMLVVAEASRIKEKLKKYVRLQDYIEPIKQLSADNTVPRFSTNLIYLTAARNKGDIEDKIIHSIFRRQPKRADVYWFVHVQVTDEPYTMEYTVDVLADEDAVKVVFYLGFRVEQRVSLFFRLVVEEMVKNGEIDITSRYQSLSEQKIAGDFRFIIIKHFLSNENDLPFWEQMVMDAYFFIKSITPSDAKWYGLDVSSVIVEPMPLIIRPSTDVKLTRVAER
jgi:KUP system potassium uptake protein